MATRRKSTDITRAELISMVARLRGALYGVLAGESDGDEIRSLLDQTAFDHDGDSFDHPELLAQQPSDGERGSIPREGK